MKNQVTALFRARKMNLIRWPLIVSALILASFLTMGAIWRSVNTMEKVRAAEHDLLMDHIAQTAQLFIKDGQLDYFYRILILLTRISFIENLGVYQDGHRLLQAGAGEQARLDDFSTNPRKKKSLDPLTVFRQRRLTENDARRLEIRAIFSLRESQEPKRVILLSFVVIAVLMITMSLLSAKHAYTLRRLQETERIRAHMIDSINHDASHDLFVIHGKLSQFQKKLRQAVDPKIIEKDIKTALESSESMVRYLNNLKDQKRLGTGNIETIPEPIVLESLIQTVTESVREKLSLRKMTLRCEDGTALKSGSKLTAWADPQIVKRILMNLIHNAIKYSPPETVIKLSLEKIAGKIRVTVRDQGTGIEKRYWEKIFEPYWQINPNSPGIGLGLYISRQFAKLSGGDLGILDSQAGAGTAFYFTLPACQPKSEETPSCSGS